MVTIRLIIAGGQHLKSRLIINEIMDKQFIIKSTPYQVKETDGKGTVVFYGSTFDVLDDDGDIIVKGAFKKTISENKNRIRYLNNHRTDQQLGVILDIQEDDTGLLVKAAINMDKTVGRDVYSDYVMAMKYGKQVEHSVGFIPIIHKGTDPRYIKEVKLFETSYVPWGANQHTPLLSVKSEDICFLDKCLKEGEYSDQRLDQLHALKVKAEQSLLQEQSAAQDDLVTFYKLLNL
jgi:HK97 family phage prohead protease